MIYVARKNVAAPRNLGSGTIAKVRDQARKYYGAPPDQRKQRRFDFSKQLGHPDIEKALALLFHNQCAFCGSSFGKGIPIIDRYRPATQAIGDPGPMPDGYWWIALDWFNLYLSCRDCSRNKGVHFPVARKRGKSPQKQRALLREEPLLLDPCHDNPDDFLSYDKETGEVFAIGDDRERGLATIDILKLNRPRLVKTRLSSGKKLRSRWMEVVKEGDFSILTSALDRSSPHQGFQRSLIRVWIVEDDLVRDWEQWERENADTLNWDLPLTVQDHREEQAERTAAKAESSLKAPLEFSVTQNVTSSELETHLDRNVFISRIVIDNFKCIEHLDLDLSEDTSTEEFSKESRPRARWQVLLGENGCGKSSVLQAVGLALMDRHERRTIFESGELKAEGLLRRNAENGSVKVFLTESTEPIGFDLTRDGTDSAKVHFLRDVHVHGTVVRAFGAVRISRKTTEAHSHKESSQRAEVENLFNPFRTLRDAEEAIADLPPARWKAAELTLGDLIRLQDKEHSLKRTEDGVFLDLGQGPVPYGDLSDGYRSVITLACDIFAGVPESYSDLRDAPGLILIDEIGTHLHPRWKMGIVQLLRDTFPNMQFLASTHEPLCLRGLEKGEIAVMTRGDDGIARAVVDDLPSPASMRIDQLLTSEHFGLSTTIDPIIDEKFQQYYALLAKPESDRDLELVEKLKRELDREGAFKPVLGYTRRDQAIYDAVDLQLAREQAAPDRATRNQIKQETKNIVADLWRDVVSTRKR